MKKTYTIGISVLIILILSFCIYTCIIFKNNMPVLAYHDVLENPTEETDISIEKFDRQMKFLKTHNYKTLTMSEFYEWKKGAKTNGKKVVLTFDDGKESFYTTVVPILEKYNLKATIFIIESAINESGYLTHEQVLDLKNNHPNITVASHSYNLHNETSANSNNYTLYDEDMKKNKENNYEFYAYPFGIKNENYENALKDNNYKLAFLFSPSKWASRNNNDFEITRVPIYKSNSMFKFKLKMLLKI